MRPQNESGRDRAVELCLLQMAIEATEQLPKFWGPLKHEPAAYCAGDPEQAAIVDLYLLVWLWGYRRSQNHDAPQRQRQFSGVKLRSRLRKLPFNSYGRISVLVRFGQDLAVAA